MSNSLNEIRDLKHEAELLIRATEEHRIFAGHKYLKSCKQCVNNDEKLREITLAMISDTSGIRVTLVVISFYIMKFVNELTSLIKAISHKGSDNE